MGEAKVFESDGFVVTTKRFVYHGSVVPLDDIQLALPVIDRGWIGMFIIGAIGLGMLAWESDPLWKFIGFLLLPGAYAFFHYTTTRKLILSMHAGESLTIEVETTPLVASLASAINSAISNAEASKREALKQDLDSLPDAE
ncbi:hypothetical protein UR09_01330 [Candidatus Nitromaritima sp. SCGC AAA799-A02]|nr:hypothetical protein UR09_01330 [Candidatus Nitromaritima sp. SCGC AAA799-A02]